MAKNNATHCLNCMWKESSKPSRHRSNVDHDPNIKIQLHKFTKGEILLKENSHINGFYCIQKGSVYVSKKDKKSNDLILWHSNPGDVVGIDSYVMKEKLRYSAYASNRVSACLVCPLDKYKFPKTLLKLTKSICNLTKSIENNTLVG